MKTAVDAKLSHRTITKLYFYPLKQRFKYRRAGKGVIGGDGVSKRDEEHFKGRKVCQEGNMV